MQISEVCSGFIGRALPHNGYSHDLQSPPKGFVEGYQSSEPGGGGRQLQVKISSGSGGSYAAPSKASRMQIFVG